MQRSRGRKEDVQHQLQLASKISHRKAKIASAWAFVVSSFEVIKKMMPRGAMLEGVGMHPASMAGFGCCVYPSHGRVDR